MLPAQAEKLKKTSCVKMTFVTYKLTNSPINRKLTILNLNTFLVEKKNLLPLLCWLDDPALIDMLMTVAVLTNSFLGIGSWLHQGLYLGWNVLLVLSSPLDTGPWSLLS